MDMNEIKLWAGILEYARACGGQPKAPTSDLADQPEIKQSIRNIHACVEALSKPDPALQRRLAAVLAGALAEAIRASVSECVRGGFPTTSSRVVAAGKPPDAPEAALVLLWGGDGPPQPHIPASSVVQAMQATLQPQVVFDVQVTLDGVASVAMTPVAPTITAADLAILHRAAMETCSRIVAGETINFTPVFEPMDHAELWDALDGLYAYDTGSTDSGIHDELLRERVKTQLGHITSDRRALLVRGWLRNAFLTGKARGEGYGQEDCDEFLQWISDDMGFRDLGGLKVNANE